MWTAGIDVVQTTLRAAHHLPPMSAPVRFLVQLCYPAPFLDPSRVTHSKILPHHDPEYRRPVKMREEKDMLTLAFEDNGDRMESVDS